MSQENRYNHKTVEPKWQKFWEENKTFHAEIDENKEKYYVLDMFPFPSGAGLHVGHPEGYTATDIICRYKRANGKNVLHPMGWDAFGLPAENYAIKMGVHPETSTKENVANFTRQIKSLGFSYDWDREFSTTDVSYYKWTQWIFLQMYNKGLLYEKKMPMNWCPQCRIVAANEEVEQGKHERCGADVERRNLRQWMFEITKYADRLLEDLERTNIILLHGFGGNGDKGWFLQIQNFCKNNNIDVLSPTFPNSNTPQYSEWKTFFEKNILSHVTSQTIFIGHSLGCRFLQRYASEEKLVCGEIILTAPPAEKVASLPEITSFLSEKDLDNEKIKNSAEKITVIYSDNDPYIPVDDFEKTIKNLDAETIFLPGREHFSFSKDTEFPEVMDILENRKKSILEWPEKIKAMQKNWIGKSEGAEVDFEIDGEKVTVFTTRPDTLFGATYFVLAPEHPLVEKITTEEKKADIEQYKKTCAAKSELERTELNKDKSGVFTGAFAINPVNGEKIPVWIADYVMMGYGTGAIMAVPAHDERDFFFAKEFNIPMIEVVEPSFTTKFNIQIELIDSETEKEFNLIKSDNSVISSFSGNNAIGRLSELEKRLGLSESILLEGKESFDFLNLGGNCFQSKEGGKLINSDFLNGLSVTEAKEKMIQWLEEKKGGARKINYKLRDWIFTRQRYWGEPIPLVYCKDCGVVPLPESELPLELPKEVESFLPTEDGQSPLAKVEDWVNTTCPTCGGKAERETSTMPNWAGSNWYWLRFMDARNDDEAFSKKAENYWGPVDLYVGGAEHAVLHLLYSRFWHKVFYDLDLVSSKEPFKKLMNQGLILAEDGQKMSKSLGNVVNPDEIVGEYGADTLRMYEMFMGPFEQSKAWNTGAVEGMYKFLQKVWRLYLEKGIGDTCPGKEFRNLTHKTVKKVSEDIEDFKFNTAISQMMIWTNAAQKLDSLPKEGASKFIRLLAPFAPHIAEEIWEKVFGNKETISYFKWPSFNEEYTKDDEIQLAVQVNGKLRATLSVAADIAKDDALAQAKANENVQKFLEGKKIVKEIFVPGKIVNIVIR